jgi:hypothetical protein
MNKAKTRAELINPWLKACSWGILEDSKILCKIYSKGEKRWKRYAIEQKLLENE